MTEMLPGIMNAFSRRRAILAPFGGIVLEHSSGLQSLTISAHKIILAAWQIPRGNCMVPLNQTIIASPQYVPSSYFY